MAIQLRSITDMINYHALYGTGFFGTTIHFEDGDKEIEDYIRYDSNTHTVTLKFTDGTIMEVPDKPIYEVDSVIPDIKPNEKRKNKKK